MTSISSWLQSHGLPPLADQPPMPAIPALPAALSTTPAPLVFRGGRPATRHQHAATMPATVMPSVNHLPTLPATAPVVLIHALTDGPDPQEVGAWVHATHTSFTVVGMVFWVAGQVIMWTPEPASAGPAGMTAVNGPCPAALIAAIAAGAVIVCADVELHRSAYRLLDWPEPVGWRDAGAVLAAHNHPAALHEAVVTLFSMPRTASYVMKRALASATCTPDSAKNASVAKRCASGRLALRLVEAVVAMLGTDPQTDLATWHAHDAINFRGVAIDRPFIEGCAEMLARLRDPLIAEAITASRGALNEPRDLGRAALVVPLLRRMGVVLPDLTAESLEQALAYAAPENEDARTIIAGLLAHGQCTTMSKFPSILARCCDDGRLRGGFTYQGHRLGRWTSVGANLHNLKNLTLPDGVPVEWLIDVVQRRSLDELRERLTMSQAFDALTGAVRLGFVPSPGNVFVVADFSRIEPRAALWMCNDLDLLQEVHTTDIYSAFTGDIYGAIVGRDHPDFELRYRVGKVGIVGGIYGMGAPTFEDYARGFGIDLAKAGTTAQRVLDAFRSRFPYIPRMWVSLSRAAVEAVLSGCSTKRCSMVYEMRGGDLHAILPSGRSIVYHQAHVGRDKFNGPVLAYTRFDGTKAEVETAWGGILTQNSVSAFCRDILAWVLVELERHGLCTVLHCHDEVVIEVLEHDVDRALALLQRIMETPPSWAEGMLLKAKPYITRRYHKESIG